MLLAGVILILVIFALIGWRKGVIRLVLSLVSMIITIMAAVVIAPMATTAIKNNTNIAVSYTHLTLPTNSRV